LLSRKLTGIAKTAKLRFHKENSAGGVSLDTFFGTWKRGSKKIRNQLQRNTGKYIGHNIVKYSSNHDIVIGKECSQKLNTLWHSPFFSNEISTFLFKFTNNTLAVNTVLSHFVRGHSRNCTFCDLILNPEIVDETTFHLFYDCTVAENIRLQFFKWLMNDNNFTINRHQFFCCFDYDVVSKNTVLQIIVRIFQHCLWECKLRKNLPDLAYCKKIIFRNISIICKTSTTFLERLRESNINLALERLG
jgi:hypothetical protein